MQALVIKKIGDRISEEIFPEPRQDEPHGDGPSSPVTDDGADDEIVMHDEDGRLLGTAKLVSGVHVYVIGDGYGTTHGELMQCLAEGSREIRVMTERGRIISLIYFPDPNRPPRTGQALRADDV
ncbi:MAG: hypothetical protein H0V24_05610 [Chloroflexia bacterium]|nr:hypothetical protein [Chloroflexia bacterium]